MRVVIPRDSLFLWTDVKGLITQAFMSEQFF